MTEKQIITMLVDDQIEQGVATAARRERQIEHRMRDMGERECEEWLADAVAHGFTY